MISNNSISNPNDDNEKNTTEHTLEGDETQKIILNNTPSVSYYNSYTGTTYTKGQPTYYNSNNETWYSWYGGAYSHYSYTNYSYTYATYGDLSKKEKKDSDGGNSSGK